MLIGRVECTILLLCSGNKIFTNIVVRFLHTLDVVKTSFVEIEAEKTTEQSKKKPLKMKRKKKSNTSIYKSFFFSSFKWISFRRRPKKLFSSYLFHSPFNFILVSVVIHIISFFFLFCVPFLSSNSFHFLYVVFGFILILISFWHTE